MICRLSWTVESLRNSNGTIQFGSQDDAKDDTIVRSNV